MPCFLTTIQSSYHHMQVGCCDQCIALDVAIFELQKLKLLSSFGQQKNLCAFPLDDDFVSNYKSKGCGFNGKESCLIDLGFRLSLSLDVTKKNLWME